MEEARLENVQVQILSQEEFAALKGEYPHKRQFINSLEYIPYCKVEVYSQCLLGTVCIPDKKNLEKPPETFGYYIQKGKICFIGDSSILEEFLKKAGELDFSMGSGERSEYQETEILLALFNQLIDREVSYLQKFEEKSMELEDMLLEDALREMPGIFMRLRKDIMKLHGFYAQLTDVGEAMQRRGCELISREQAEDWNIFTSRVSRLHGYTENIRESLLQLHELYQAQIDIRQNEIMAMLTVVTTIFLPLSLLTGWYGMNFTNMPLLSWKYGYVTVILLAAVILGLELRYFWRKGYLKRKNRFGNDH